MSVTLRRRTLRNGRVQLYLDIYVNGQRKREATKLSLNGDRFHNKETLRLAEILRAKRELEVQADATGLKSDIHKKTSFIDYMVGVAEKSRSKGARDSWYNGITKFKAFLDGRDVTFGQLTKGLIEDYKDFLLKGLHQNTAQKYLALIKTALYHAMRHDMITQNPAQFITIKKVETLPKFLTLDEVKLLAITECENQNVRNAFLFSCFAGLRYGDIQALKWENIKDGYLEFTQRKTGNSERFPLGVQATKILEEQREIGKSEKTVKEYPEGTVFFLPRQSTVDKALKRWAERAKIGKSISFHKGRHTFATLSLTFGVDLYTTSKLLGHRDLKTTQIYAKVVDEKKLQAVNMLPII
jgi:site-specific recombinase XerD